MLVGLVLTAGCMTRFITGPGRNAIPSRTVVVELAGCETRRDLFDCRSLPAVGAYLGDYLKLNGLAPAPSGSDGARARLRVFEDRGVVAVEVSLVVPQGLAWRAEAQGDTLLRSLVRLEDLLHTEASFRERFLTADVQKRLEALGRKELSADKNTFTYR
jgi:hypothetical protein